LRTKAAAEAAGQTGHGVKSCCANNVRIFVTILLYCSTDKNKIGDRAFSVAGRVV